MPEKSPLSEAEPKSLDDLYTADTLSLTDDDVDKITADLRQKRSLWATEEAEAQSQGRRRKPKAYKTPPPKGQLKLGDLGIGKLKE